jgi:hypothetical protein
MKNVWGGPKTDFWPHSSNLKEVQFWPKILKWPYFCPHWGGGQIFFAHRTPPMGRRDPTIRIVKTEFFPEPLFASKLFCLLMAPLL